VKACSQHTNSTAVRELQCEQNSRKTDCRALTVLVSLQSCNWFDLILHVSSVQFMCCERLNLEARSSSVVKLAPHACAASLHAWPTGASLARAAPSDVARCRQTQTRPAVVARICWQRRDSRVAPHYSESRELPRYTGDTAMFCYVFRRVVAGSSTRIHCVSKIARLTRYKPHILYETRMIDDCEHYHHQFIWIRQHGPYTADTQRHTEDRITYH